MTDISSSPGTPDPAGTGIDTTVPHSARIWNYWLVEPGVVLVADWRPDPSADRGPEIPQMGGVGRKP